MSTDNPCERHLFGADGQCVGCGKSGPPKTTTMSMTPERLARWRGFAAESPDNEFADVVDAVEALQAELAEERAKSGRLRCAACGSALLLENGWMHDYCPCNAKAGCNSHLTPPWLVNLTEQRQSAELELMANDWAYGDPKELIQQRDAAMRMADQAEDIANLAMRVGREMYSDAQYWRERHCRESALNAEQSQKNWQRAEKAERELAETLDSEREWQETAERFRKERDASVVGLTVECERVAELRAVADAVSKERDDLRARLAACESELAEERANHRVCHDVALMWRKRCAEDGDIANLAMRQGLEMVTRLRLDAEIDAHDRISCMIESNERRARAELAERDRDAAIQRAEKAERERDRYLADANEYALQIHDLRARLAACVAALEEIDTRVFHAGLNWARRRARRALAAAKGSQ